MGSRGPVAKRSDQRAGHRAKRDLADTVAVPYVVDPPELEGIDALHPLAVRYYGALAQSGQAKHYEPSDWDLAQLAARMRSVVFAGLDRGVLPGAGLLAELSKIDARLGVTENDRRRYRVEVDRPQGGGAITARIDEAKLRIVERVAQMQ